MKTKSQNQNRGLKSRPEQLNTVKQQSEAEHNANRELPTTRVLEILQSKLPQEYDLAEIVGQWIWLEVPQFGYPFVKGTLWRLGFHWNPRRGVWQHPCGAFAPYASHPGEPRAKYGSHFAANLKPV